MLSIVHSGGEGREEGREEERIDEKSGGKR